MSRRNIAFATVLVLSTFSPALAASMPSGCDCWATESPGTTIQIDGLAGYFPGCTLVAPLNGVVAMEGNPPVSPPPGGCDNVQVSWTDPHGRPVDPNDNHKVGQSTQQPGNIDTVVCRTDTGTFANPGSADDIPIEMLELSLRSVGCPISVTCPEPRTYRVNLTLDGDQASGSGHFVAASTTPALTGDIDLTSLPVNFKLDFVRCDAAGAIGPIQGLSIDFTQNTSGTFSVPTGPVVPILDRWVEILLAGLLVALTAWFLMTRRRQTMQGGAA